MIPFARILKYGNAVIPVDKNILLDIDFDKQNVGDTVIKDWSFVDNKFTVSSGFSAGTVGNDATLGRKVMLFNGGTQYFTPNNLNLHNIDYVMQIQFRSNSTGTTARTCTGTGMWGNSTRNPGTSWVLNTSGTGDNGCYMWFDRGATTGTQFLRAAMPAPAYVAGTWETVTVTVNRLTGVDVHRSSTNTTLHYAYYAFGAGLGYYIGGVPGYSPSIAMTGAISKILITKTGG